MRGGLMAGVLAGAVACGGAATGGGAPTDAGAGNAADAAFDAGVLDAADASEIDAADAGDAPSLPPGIYPLAGTDQTMAQDDLTPLLAIVGSASNVGLGESIHTSGGFEAMKARVVRFLVEKGGFRVLAMETPRTGAMEITGRYVTTCAGSPTDAAAGFFSVFASDATRDLLAWMCAWNQSHAGDPVQFVGFDAQQPWTDWDALGTFLQKAAPADAVSLFAPLKSCDGSQAVSEDDYWRNHSNDPYPQASFDACGKGLDAVDAYLQTNAAAMTQRTSAEAYAQGKLSALSLRSWQGERFYTDTDQVRAFESRDLAMATIYESLRSLYFAQKKALLWAHNYHLMKNHPAASDPKGIPGARTMGTVLARDLGDAYAPIGLSGWDVQINWPGIGKGPTATPASADEVEWKLHGLGLPWLLVDLADARPGALLTPGATYGYGNPWSMSVVPADQFRAIVYFDSSPGMHALFW